MKYFLISFLKGGVGGVGGGGRRWKGRQSWFTGNLSEGIQPALKSLHLNK